MTGPYEGRGSATTGPARSDCCSARAVLAVVLPSGRELAFCRSHYRRHALALNELLAPLVVAEATSAPGGSPASAADPDRGLGPSPPSADAGTDRTGQASSRIR